MSIEENFLAKWISSEITEEELLDYISEEELETYKNIANRSTLFQPPSFSEERIYENIISCNKPYSKSKVIYFNNYFYRIAAIFILAFISYWGTGFLNTTVRNVEAHKMGYHLPDGSQVILNKSSEIKFNKRYWETNRTLTLSGEAFFEVEKGETFEVKLSRGSVKVLGTQFNIKEMIDAFEVSCFEGAVRVDYEEKTDTLTPGNKIIVNSGLFLKKHFYADNPEWLLEESTFNSKPLSTILKEIETLYKVEIIPKKIDTDIIFTGSIPHKNIKVALESVCNPLGLKFTILANNRVVIYASE